MNVQLLPCCRGPESPQQQLLQGSSGKTKASLQVSIGSDRQGECMLALAANSRAALRRALINAYGPYVQEHKAAIAFHFSLPSWGLRPVCWSFTCASGHVSIVQYQEPMTCEAAKAAACYWHV